MQSTSQLSARDRVLDVAERLFSERGYAAVTLRDIANALQIKQASLYYHAPQGKTELFVRVTERGMERHHAGLEAAMTAGGDLRQQLRGAARWLLAQPALNFARMMQSDMPAIGAEDAERLRIAAHRALIQPLEQAFLKALPGDPNAQIKAGCLAGAFLSLIEGVHGLPASFGFQPPRQTMADFLIDTLLDGLDSARSFTEFDMRRTES